MESSSRSNFAPSTAFWFHCSNAATVGRSLSCSRSVIAGARGTLSFTPLGLVPINDAFLPYIEEAHQHQPDVHQHFPEAKHLEIARDYCPWVEEDGFHVKEDEQHRNHIKLDAEALLGVSGRHDAAFIRRIFDGTPLMLANQVRKQDHDPGKGHGHNNLDKERDITSKIVVRHERACI